MYLIRKFKRSYAFLTNIDERCFIKMIYDSTSINSGFIIFLFKKKDCKQCYICSKKMFNTLPLNTLLYFYLVFP